MPRDSGGFWFTKRPVSGGEAWLAVYGSLETAMDYSSFQSRLALFEPETSALRMIATTEAAGDCVADVDSDGRFVVWSENRCDEMSSRGWKTFAFDLQTDEKWEVVRDSEVPFGRSGLDLRYEPFLSVQGGRLAYSLLTADSSGQPVVELRVVDLVSRVSATVLGPFDAQESSFYQVSLYGDTLIWTWNVWRENQVAVRGLWKMELPDGEPEVLAVGDIGGFPMIFKKNVVYDTVPDPRYPERREAYILNLETGDKKEIAQFDGQTPTLRLMDGFVSWVDQINNIGVLLDLETGERTNVGVPYSGGVRVVGNRVFWQWRPKSVGGSLANRVFLQWADLPEQLPQ
jgi:hypothetical protein